MKRFSISKAYPKTIPSHNSDKINCGRAEQARDPYLTSYAHLSTKPHWKGYKEVGEW